MIPISDEQFRKTEGRLYRYYRQLRDIDKMEHKVKILEEQIKCIEDDIKHNNVSLEEESRSITYEERVQSSSDGTSYAEKELIRQIENLELEAIFLRKKKAKLEYRIRESKREITDIECTIKLLDEYSQMLVKMKYGNIRKISNYTLAMELNSTEPTIRNKKKEIVNLVCKCLDIKG
ncbi:MAG: hypothetical protein Q8936_01775 [Bacillota bacterium]|nr:hypothetical protein [Bacillota bacterium]